MLMQSVDDNTRSQDSFSRDEDSFNDSVFMKSIKEGEASEPLVDRKPCASLAEIVHQHLSQTIDMSDVFMCKMFRTEDQRVDVRRLCQ